MCVGPLDLTPLKRTSKYEDGYTDSSACIAYLWHLLLADQDFTDADKRLFLKFISGRYVLVHCVCGHIHYLAVHVRYDISLMNYVSLLLHNFITYYTVYCCIVL